MPLGRLNKVCIAVSLGLIAALGAGCAKQQATYVAVDPTTGQQYAVVQQAQPQFATTTTYQQPVQYQSRGFELYGQGGGVSAQAQVAPSFAPATTTNDIPNRGFFTSHHSAVPAPQVQQSYVVQYQAPAVAAAPAQTYVMQQPAAVVQARARAVVAPAPAGPSYSLDSGDKLRVTVFGQEGLTNSYTVDAGGNINMPLIGAQPARGLTTPQLAGLITQRLKQGFVRDPSVSVEIELYRPFFILGEVTTPGQYPYVANLTVESAVAIAGGFSPRASKRSAELTRSTGPQQFRSEVPLNTPIKPGDTIVVKERWF
jgi:protein involved in polysaccharide export with SLBB domain